MRIIAMGALALLIAGCVPGQNAMVSGGGWIASPVLGEKATFGFQAACARGRSADVCEPRGTGEYHDQGADVRMRLVLIGTSGGTNCQAAEVEYRSADPKVSGGGTANVSVCDNDAAPGPPGGLPDTFSIVVGSGPYAGYTNSGPVLGGNIRVTLP